MTVLRFATHLWFDDRAAEAATFYTSLFQTPGSNASSRHPPASPAA
jgi:predicted 3-demethylubiquinone-9 3-methyltransferase (glyoxalase superfamily)